MIVKHLTCRNDESQLQAVCCLTAVAKHGTDAHRQILVDQGALYAFGVLLAHRREAIRKEACTCLASLCRSHFHVIMALKLVPKMVQSSGGAYVGYTSSCCDFFDAAAPVTDDAGRRALAAFGAVAIITSDVRRCFDFCREHNAHSMGIEILDEHVRSRLPTLDSLLSAYATSNERTPSVLSQSLREVLTDIAADSRAAEASSMAATMLSKHFAAAKC